MRKSFIKTLGVMTFIAILLFVQVALPLQASADAFTSPTLNYANPNQFTNGSNPYAFKVSDVLNPQLLTQVIGCTGIVNQVSKVSADFIKKVVTREASKLATHTKIATATGTQSTTTATANATAKAADTAIKGGAVIAAATPTGIVTSDAGAKLVGVANLSVSTVDDIAKFTKEMAAIQVKNVAINAPTDAVVGAVNSAQNSIDTASYREECINGIAIQLAKNELVAFTRDTMNWVTTGFGGSPFYPRDTDSFMNSLTQYYLQKEVNYFETLPDAHAGDFPWGRDYARGQVNIFQAVNSGYDALKSDMDNYLYSGYTLQNYSTNFSAGGWNAWLGMTMHPQNNPLGFTAMASDNLARTQARAINNAQQELQQNGGIFDQKKCVEWSKQVAGAVNAGLGFAGYGGTSTGQKNGLTTTVINPSTPTSQNGPACIKWETVSPGSVILSKINTYVNSPELQLTLVKTLNDALNALFASLIGRFENQGLSGLGTTSVNLTNGGGQGFGSNELFDSSGNLIPLGGGENTGSGNNSDGSFDITKDLGNTYAQPINDGYWDASTNTPALTPGVGTKDHYYIVSVSGSTDLTGNGDYWHKGDKAFFDGTAWSNGISPYIITKEGVLQKQQDYLDDTKQYLTVVNGVLPALGQLDYCIPGPNPNWQNNALTAQQTLASDSNQDTSTYWATVGTDFINQYAKQIDTTYGPSSPMQTPTNPDGSANPAYLQMSQAGLALTANIPGYVDSVTKAKTDMQSIVDQTNSDITKLNTIKDKVNAIIAAAQKRRALERAQNGLPAFKKSCLDAEKVTYVVNGVLK